MARPRKDAFDEVRLRKTIRLLISGHETTIKNNDVEAFVQIASKRFIKFLTSFRSRVWRNEFSGKMEMIKYLEKQEKRFDDSRYLRHIIDFSDILADLRLSNLIKRLNDRIRKGDFDERPKKH